MDEVVRRLLGYRNDALGFVVDVLKAEPTSQQAELLRGISEPGAKVAVRSGHGVGKSSCMAWCILWYLWTRSGAKVPCTAPSAHQLHDVLWAEVDMWRRRLPGPMAEATVVKKEEVVIEGAGRGHFAVARTARRESPDALQGFHAKHLMFVIDEASGVCDEVFEVARGALTTPGARAIMAGNPVSKSGYFFDVFNRGVGGWKLLQFNGEESPLVSREYIEHIAAEFGRDSDVYRVRVLGEFPRASLSQYISRGLVEMAAGRGVVGAGSEYAPVIFGVDVSYYGDDRSVICARQGLRAEILWSGREVSTLELADKVRVFAQVRRPKRIFVDIVGVGAGVVDALRSWGLPVVGVNGGAQSGRVELANKRAEMWYEMKKWLEEGGVIPADRELMDDLVTPQFAYHPISGKIRLESKQVIRGRGGRSPDLADALALTFAYPVSGVRVPWAGVVVGGRQRTLV